MTKHELNRDIKRLGKRFMAYQESYDEQTEKELKVEFRRLYSADYSMTYMNRTSILIMTKLNRTLQVIPQHIYGIYIELKTIIK